jgi:hypothetical protein
VLPAADIGLQVATLLEYRFGDASALATGAGLRRIVDRVDLRRRQAGAAGTSPYPYGKLVPLFANENSSAVLG